MKKHLSSNPSMTNFILVSQRESCRNDQDVSSEGLCNIVSQYPVMREKDVTPAHFKDIDCPVHSESGSIIYIIGACMSFTHRVVAI